jgi:hypothetical protein
LDRRAELGRDDDKQREAVRSVRHLGIDDADRLNREQPGEGQFQRTGIFALVIVEIEIAAALDHAGIKREADAIGRLKPERQIDRSQGLVRPVREGQHRLDAHPLNTGGEWPEIAGDRR